MIRYLNNQDFARNKNESMECIYHFSIADYYNPDNINFGKLRVFNDEIIKPNAGFDLHLHRNLEIFSYILEGELTHKDSLDNFITLKSGDLQHMSAGKGIYHSEINTGKSDLKLLQIWVLPKVRNLDPKHTLINTSDFEIKNKPFLVASSKDAPIIVNQDINMYLLKLKTLEETVFEVAEDRQAYLVQIEGSSNINKHNLNAKDALEIIEENITIKAHENSHIIIIEMKKG